MDLVKEERFRELMRMLRIERGDTIICYDDQGVYSSPRVAWTLKYFGGLNVRVLNGGLRKWISEGRSLEVGDTNIEESINEADGDFDYKIVNE